MRTQLHFWSWLQCQYREQHPNFTCIPFSNFVSKMDMHHAMHSTSSRNQIMEFLLYSNRKSLIPWNFLQNWCQEFELGLIFESPRTTPYFIKSGAEVDTNCLSHIMLSSVNRSPWWLGRRRRRGQEDGRQHRCIDEILLTDYIKQVHSSLLQV